MSSPPLTSHQKEILSLLSLGYEQSAAAAILDMPLSTLSKQVRRLRERYNANTTTQLCVMLKEQILLSNIHEPFTH